MIPILFDQSEKLFTSGGLGFLKEATSCKVSQERNGIYECEFTYPITGPLYDKIQEKTIIFATHDNSGEPQPFDIYARSAPIDGLVTFYAHHISSRLSNAVVMPFTASGIADAMEKIQANIVTDDDFTFWTDKTTSGEYAKTVPSIVRTTLGGEEGSLLDVYGRGDYIFDKFAVRLYQDKGEDNNVEIRYGKNLVNITHKVDFDESYNAIVPYWLNEETGDLRTLPEGYVSYDDGTAYIVAIPFSMNEYFETMPTVEAMRQKAQQLLDSSDAWEPSEGFEVNFVQLWETEEYEQFAPLQKVNLCDIVHVYYKKLGIDAVRERVVKTVYNTLLDRYDEITLNELPTTLTGMTQQQINDATSNSATNEGVTAQINLAVQLLRGDLGGYIATPADENGLPQLLYIMDSPNKSTAVNVIRLDQNGISISRNGIDSESWTQIYNLSSNTWTFPGLTVSGNLVVSGGLTVSGNISASGDISADEITSSSVSTGGLTVSGNASVGGDLTVTGTIINGGA